MNSEYSASVSGKHGRASGGDLGGCMTLCVENTLELD